MARVILYHIPSALAQGNYKWGRGQVLRKLAVFRQHKSWQTRNLKQLVYFITAEQLLRNCPTQRVSVLAPGNDWSIKAKVPH